MFGRSNEALMNIFLGLETGQKASRKLVTDGLAISIDENSRHIILNLPLFVREREPTPCGEELKYRYVRNVQISVAVIYAVSDKHIKSKLLAIEHNRMSSLYCGPHHCVVVGRIKREKVEQLVSI